MVQIIYIEKTDMACYEEKIITGQHWLKTLDIHMSCNQELDFGHTWSFDWTIGYVK
jgi:hypothetical protein